MLDVKFMKKFRYLAKKELFQKKFSGACMRQFGGVAVDRQNADPKAIKEIFLQGKVLFKNNVIKNAIFTIIQTGGKMP